MVNFAKKISHLCIYKNIFNTDNLTIRAIVRMPFVTTFSQLSTGDRENRPMGQLFSS